MPKIANAPVSYGAFELTVGRFDNLPSGSDLLEIVADSGYSGIDLGPVGYLGQKDNIRKRLEDHNLGLAGGFVELPLYSANEMKESWAELESVLQIFDQVTALNDSLLLPAPKVTLSVTGRPIRSAFPGQASSTEGFYLSNAEWKILVESLREVQNRCFDHGITAVFHNETGTDVESRHDLERVLEDSTIDLCLDTGHLLICGDDPIDFFRSAKERIAQIHLKSAYTDRMSSVIDRELGVDGIWAEQVFCQLGKGDLDADRFVTELLLSDYDGWIVVEQDIFPTEDSFNPAQVAQIENREFLRSYGV